MKRLPLRFVEHKLATIRQRLRGRRHARVKQELADILVAGTCGILQQLLDQPVARTSMCSVFERLAAVIT